MTVLVVTADQHRSRSRADAVPALLTALARAAAPLRPFQRTVGDEVQGVVDDPGAAVALLARLLRDGDWSVGVGVAEVERPLPPDTRAGRGQAYVDARTAVTRAKTVPHRVAVVGADRYRAEHLETVLWLWAGLLERRSERGWQVYDALAEGLSHEETARRLGVTASAVSQRAQAAGLADERRAVSLVHDLVAELLDDEGRQE